jgi:D-alanine-D-alanine ligase
MKVAIIYNKDLSGVINVFGMQNKEVYNPETVKRVANALEAGGHNVAVVDGNMKVVEQLQQFMPKVVDGEQMGMVFNMAYGIQGESRYTHIPSMLEMLGIPYVGSSPSGHALALDKVITKIILQKQGIPTPDFWVFSHAKEDMSHVTFPVIVKPKMESVSFGLKVVHNAEDLAEAVDFIVTEYQQQALVEQFIRGREFAVGLVGNAPSEALPVLEIDLDNDPDAIQTVDDKQKKPRKKICPAELLPEVAASMQKYSVDAFNALQLRDFSRVDIRMDEKGQIYVLEINSMASLGSSGSYVHAAGKAGYTFEALVNRILDAAAVRYFATRVSADDLHPSSRRLPAQTRIRGFLRGRQEQLENMLQRAVNTNTYVRNVEGVNELGNQVRKELGQLGFRYQVIRQVEVGNLLYFSNTESEHVDVLILGSLDNRQRIADQQYYQSADQRLSGTGIWEHKGGIVATIAALQSLRFLRILRKMRIGLLFTTDTSLEGKFAQKYVREMSDRAQYVIGTHGGDPNGSLVTSRSGAAYYRMHMHLKETGNAGLVSLASSVFAKLIHTWCELAVKEEGLLIAPNKTTMNSNIMDPYIHGETSLSVRFNDVEQYLRVDKKIRSLIPAKKYAKTILFQIEGGLRRNPFHETETVESFWKLVKPIADKLDIRLTKEHRWSSSDICFVDPGKHALDGFGPVGKKDQEKTEYILRHSLLERALLMAMTLKEITGIR